MTPKPKKPFNDDDLARTFESVLWQICEREPQRCKVIIERMRARLEDEPNGDRQQKVQKAVEV